MDPNHHRQIYGWIQTGQHCITAEYIHCKSPCPEEDGLTAELDDENTASSTSSSTVPTQLIGAEGDILIPHTAEINRVYAEGRETWSSLVTAAEALEQESWPPGIEDASILLMDVPALPSRLPKSGILTGQPVWLTTSPEEEQIESTSGDWDLRHVFGARKNVVLSLPKPVECRISSQHRFYHHDHTLPSASSGSAAPEGLSILTLCWSCILSVRCLELQGRQVRYSEHCLQPRVVGLSRCEAKDVVIRLEAPASRNLVRWLCAVLAPKPGWLTGNLGFPPWAAFCTGDVRFVISTSKPLTFAATERPPSSAQATELLIEFCTLFGLCADKQSKQSKQSSGSLPPYTAAFVAALALPICRYHHLQPQFPVPSLRRRKVVGAEFAAVRQYAADIRYYMAISMQLLPVGSVIWSIFWQPGIECNLVSPWLSSILAAIRPIVDAERLDILAKVFALRRPRVGLWWLGIFLLGDRAILDRIVRYLETLEEQWGFGSLSPPDTTMAAWTGAPQSFLDEEGSDTYPNLTDQVPRARLLRLRYHFILQDPMITHFSWRPFGHVLKRDIEPDLWPWLECGYSREYLHWVWWIKEGKDTVQDVQLGFRRDTGRFVADVPDNLETISVKDEDLRCPGSDIKLEPSYQSTRWMLNSCVQDSSGDRDADIAAMPGFQSYPWLKEWRGLE